tara:strand:+ start:2033 stop:2182 length:150 start_codon:yes stop_codon:yes gene_type:complete
MFRKNNSFYDGRIKKKTLQGAGGGTKIGKKKGKYKKYRGQGGPRKSIKN